MTGHVNIPEHSKNKDIEFKEIAASFYGCTGGNIHSPVWICGLEPGGGYEELNLELSGGYKELYPIYMDSLEPHDFEWLHAWNAKDFEASFGPPEGSFRENVIKLLYALKLKGWDSSKTNYKETDKWDENGITGPNGIAMILNALPISFKGRAVVGDEWNKYRIRYKDGKTEKLSKWTKLPNFGAYREYVINERSKIYIEERKRRTPKLIIALGKGDWKYFKKLWGAEDQYGADKEFEKAAFKFSFGNSDCVGYWLENGKEKEKTMLLMAPFPYAWSHEQINTFAKELEKILGEDWLSKSLDQMTNSRLEELKNPGLISESLFFKIRDVKKLSNEQLTCLEQIEDLTKKPEFLSTFKEKLTGLNKLKEKIKKHLDVFDKMSQDVKLLCDQEELKDSGLIDNSLLNKIRDVKELSNQQLTCLEQIEDLTKKPEFLSTFKEKLIGLNELKTKFIEQLKVFDELSQIAKRLCDQERNLVWKKVLKNKSE